MREIKFRACDGCVAFVMGECTARCSQLIALSPRMYEELTEVRVTLKILKSNMVEHIRRIDEILAKVEVEDDKTNQLSNE